MSIMHFNKVTLTVFLYAIFISITHAQDDRLGKSIPLRVRYSWESVNNMLGETNMGLMGAGVESFDILKKTPNFYSGFQSYAALTGRNGGFFAFGLTSGYRLPLINNSLFLEFGGFAGGGGDGKRAEDGGLIFGGKFEVEKRFGFFGLRAGVSHMQFVPSHQSTHLTLGFTVIPSMLVLPKIKEVNEINNAGNIIFDRLRLSVLGKVLMLNNLEQKVGPNRDIKGGLMGLQLNYFLTPNLYANMEINGASTGNIYGYMSYFFGVGAISPRIANFVAIEGSISGGSNGGSPYTLVGGGAIVQPEVGLNFRILDNIYIKTLAGRSWTPTGSIDHPHFSVALGTDVKPSRLKGNYLQSQNISITDSIKIQSLGIYTFNRTYFTNSSGLSTRGKAYDKVFNLIGLGIRKYFTPKFSVSGSTVWTYTGSYGGYGEGYFSGAYHQNILKKSDALQLEIEAGIGAAGGILNVGAGLVTKYGVGAKWKIGKNTSMFIQGGEMNPVGGNFQAYYLDFGGQIQLDAVFGK